MKFDFVFKMQAEQAQEQLEQEQPMENTTGQTTEQNISVESTNKLSVLDYSDKSFVVYGDGTKEHKTDLKNLGGKFNKYLKNEGNNFPGWIFSLKKKEEVMEFVHSVNSGKSPFIPKYSFNTGDGLPTVSTPVNTSKFQYVKFKIFCPKENMSVSLNTNGKTVNGTIIKTETHDDIVDTIYIDFGGKTSLGVICRGKWTIFGLFDNHSIYFS